MLANPTLTDLATISFKPATFHYACRRIAAGEDILFVVADLKLDLAQAAYLAEQTRPDDGPCDIPTTNKSADVTPRHPAKWSQAVLDRLAPIVDAEHERLGRELRILDPFAGTDADRLQAAVEPHGQVVGVELEPEWAAASTRTVVGDALHLRFSPSTFDAVITSPTYGNRMADDHDAKDDSRRNTYRHALGHELADGTSANLQWGPAYRRFHSDFVAEAIRVLRPGGLLVVNVKNHIRAGAEQLVAEWWAAHLLAAPANTGCGLGLVEVARVDTPGLRYGQNHEARVDGELIIATRTPKET